MKMQYTEEQIARANHTDLVSFLNEQGEQLVKSGREYRWKKHDSVTVSGNRWYRHSQSKGGYPVDFVMEFYYATFPEAVKMLIGEEGEGRQKSCPAPSKDFRLPEKNEDNEMIVKYLTESRALEKNLVMEWIARGDIYEEKKHHNVIFVGRDADGIPRYAHCRGTGEMKYRGDVVGSDKSSGFCYRGTDNKTDYKIEGFFEYVVPPLEGFWWQDNVESIDYTDKSAFNWISVIRLPDFITKKDFDWAVETASKKKKMDCSGAEFLSIDEGLCVQIMHIGAFDDEPATVAMMDKYLEENGYVNDFTDERRHHEIYLSDPRKVAPEKCKTVIRHPIKKA